MAKTRVHELAKKFDVDSKFVLEKLKEMGEFVNSGLGHVSPSGLETLVRGRCSKPLAVLQTHREVLIECS